MKTVFLRWSGVLVVFCLVAVLACSFTPLGFAQETTGGIKVNVKDKTGAAVPKATALSLALLSSPLAH